MSTTPDPDNIHLDTWITHQLNDLTDQVSEQLDLDSGLQDAQLVNRAQQLDESLDEILDIESGLLAILGRDAHAQQEAVVPDSNESTVSAPSLTQYARTFASLPVDERLRLRSQPSFRVLTLIQGLVGLPAHHQNVIAVLDLALAETQAANTHTYNSPYVLARSRDLGLALDLVRVLARTRDLARDLAFARALDLVRDLVRAHDVAAEVVRVLARVRDRARDGVPDRNIDLALDLVRARDVAHLLDHDLDLVRVRDLVRALARALDNARLLGAALRADVSRISTGSEFAALASAIESVEAAAADFTTADLTHQDLLKVDLCGVRWSALTTHWPPGWEEPMREASVRIDPDGRPDLYEVRDEPRVRRDAHKP